MHDIRVPDVVGEVTGWRAWQLVGTIRVPRLMSINAAGRVGVTAGREIFLLSRERPGRRYLDDARRR